MYILIFSQFLTIINNTKTNILVYLLFPSPTVSLEAIPKNGIVRSKDTHLIKKFWLKFLVLAKLYITQFKELLCKISKTRNHFLCSSVPSPLLYRHCLSTFQLHLLSLPQNLYLTSPFVFPLVFYFSHYLNFYSIGENLAIFHLFICSPKHIHISH